MSACGGAGVYRLLSKAGAVSAVPIQLMSDHIFLGASLVAILSAELVLLRCSLRRAACPIHVKCIAQTGRLPLNSQEYVSVVHILHPRCSMLRVLLDEALVSTLLARLACWQALHMCSLLQCRIVTAGSPFRREDARASTQVAGAGLIAAATLLVLTCGDMHFTARFFHERTETLLGAVLGLLAFQIPIAWWLLYGFHIN